MYIVRITSNMEAAYIARLSCVKVHACICDDLECAAGVCQSVVFFTQVTVCNLMIHLPQPPCQPHNVKQLHDKHLVAVSVFKYTASA
jgi:hypothetical protein